jgi:histidinol-phosphatase (PHP family)
MFREEKNMYDSHIHTKFSTDSSADIEDVIEQGNKLELGLIITEHMDLTMLGKDKFVFNPSDYFNEYSKYRNKKLLLGVELGMDLDFINEGKQIIEQNSFDFVIGSVHFIDGVDFYTNKSLFNGRSKKEAYKKYLECCLESIKGFDFFDSLAHIDYICRCSIYDDKELYYDDYRDILDELFKVLISTGKVIEINGRRLGDKYAVENLKKLYRRYYELGGRYITIGSDAHTAGNVGSNFKEIIGIAEYSSLKPVYFKNRKMEYA